MPVKRAAEAQPNLLLRRARQERGWSQQEVADLIEAPHAYMVTRWENGTALPGPGYRHKLSKIFGKTSQELGLVKRPTAPLPEAGQTSDLLKRSEKPQGGIGSTPIYDSALPLHTSQRQNLVGRDQILTRLKQQLCHTDARKNLALDGLPGVGKTTLAAKLASSSDVQAHFSDGVLWAGLGPKPNIQTHLQRWGQLAGLPKAEQDADVLAQSLRQFLWNRHMLIVLDDVWTVEDALACVVGGQHCTYLLTTRIPEVAAQFAGEDSLHLPELDLEDGVHLLLRIAPTLQKVAPASLRSLVQTVGGLPLALILMGNYLLLQSRHQQRRRLQTALIQLQQREERLRLAQPQAGLDRDVRLPIGTPLTLQAMIDLSEAILDETAREALYALSIFPPKPGSFSEEAALAVTAVPVDVLDRLVDVGLVESCGLDRYTLHQTIADYALARRSDPQVEQRLIAYVLGYVEKHQQMVYAKNNEALSQELPLILEVLDLALRIGHRDEFVRCICAVASFLYARGFLVLTEQWLRQAQTIAQQQQDYQHIFTILWLLGEILGERGAYEEARVVLEGGVTLAREQDDRRILILMLNTIGMITGEHYEITRAEAFLQEAVALAREIANPELLSQTLNYLGCVDLMQGNALQAKVHFQEALALLRTSQPHDLANYFSLTASLGYIDGKQGNFAVARIPYQETIAFYRLNSLHSSLAHILCTFGNTLRDEGDYAGAKGAYQEAITLARKTGQAKILVRAFHNLTLLALNEGHIEQAQAFLAEESRLMQPNNRRQMSMFLLTRGLMETYQGHYQQACDTLQEGLALARTIENNECICHLLLTLSGTLIRMGRREEALPIAQEGLEIARQMGLALLTGMGLAVIGHYHLQRGEIEEAHASFQAILTETSPGYDCMGRAHEGLALVAQKQDQYELARQEGEAALHCFSIIGHQRAHSVKKWLTHIVEYIPN